MSAPVVQYLYCLCERKVDFGFVLLSVRTDDDGCSKVSVWISAITVNVAFSQKRT
jgi:hypothetical protein